MMDNKTIVIGVDRELIEILERLKKKIKIATWDGLDKISYKDLTRILAKKVNAAKLI